jgi:hypothetical protein
MPAVRISINVLVFVLSLEFSASAVYRLVVWGDGYAQYLQSGLPFWFYGTITALQFILAILVWVPRLRPLALLTVTGILAAAILSHSPFSVTSFQSFGLPAINIVVVLVLLVLDWHYRRFVRLHSTR